ncbi:MAG: porin [Pseudolabrys sp.]|nr:porin [Pseudolabrys sp.]
MAWRGVFVATGLWAAGASAFAAEPPAVCLLDQDRAAKTWPYDADDPNRNEKGVRFDLAGACAELTAGVSYTYQHARKSTSGLPVIVNRNGTLSDGSSSNTVSAYLGLETSRDTTLGEFKTTVSASWSKATGDGSPNGTFSVSGWSVGLGGLTVGYTGTLMSFWESEFLSTATAPGRSANTIVYEYAFDDANTIAAGLESNLPTTPEAVTGLKNFDFSDPVYTLRWRYDSEALRFHLSGLARRADFSASPLLPLFPDTATVRTGWAASIGLAVPTPFTGESDEIRFQATYAVDASSYLGISNDLTTYQHTVRSRGPTTGWSAVGSFRHVWSEQFESNIFASYLTLRADLLLAKPQAQTFRTGVNLYWKPRDKVKLGVELGTVDNRLEPNGIVGIFSGSSGRALVGYLSMAVDL